MSKAPAAEPSVGLQTAVTVNNYNSDLCATNGCLRYAREYYRSGTKQTEGSRLDRIVEGWRNLAAEARITQMLGKTAEKDVGTEAERRISEFGDMSPN